MVFILFFVLTGYYCMQTSYAKADTLAIGDSISDGQTLVSVGETFVLGFFNPSSSSRNRYVGIWYGRVAEPTVVWVANRQNPIPDKSGRLTINSNGNLMILDSIGSPYMSTTVSATNHTSAITAKLLDTGNLVLYDGNPDLGDEVRILWQSFDYPTDTYLPHMTLGLNKITREKRLLKSWRSPEDPAAGDYTLVMDPNGTSQFIILQGGTRYWTSGVWNGQFFSLLPEMAMDTSMNFSFVSDGKENSFSYAPWNDSVLVRIVMDFSGQIIRLTWLEESKIWDTDISQPRSLCDVYNQCGASASCDKNSIPICRCLEGFEPASMRDWRNGVWTGGCQRKTALQCGKSLENEAYRDGFQKLPNMLFSGNRQPPKVDSHEQCELACLNNCTCSAFAFLLVKEEMLNERRCFLLEGELFNLKHISVNESITAGGDLYLRLAAADLISSADERSKSKRRLWVIVAVVVAVLVLFGIFLCYLWRKKIKEKELRTSNQKPSLLQLGSTNRICIASKLEKGWDKGSELQLFSFVHIAAATNNFSSMNKLGQGGFGPVYKGKLLEGHEIAVKRLSKCSGQGLEEFINEVTLIAKVQHMNLVRLLGCCIEGDEKMLIYEYMPNKSLDFFLFDPIMQKQLDWKMRVHIIDGIAQGLLYLHKYSRLRIIHRDLKTSNILLDGETNPKISDFGMARIVGRNESEANTNRIVGTYGYMSPEYAMEGLFSEKSDVYSFGVLLLEIVCGKKNTIFYHFDRSLNLLGYAWELWKEGNSIKLMDPTLSGSSAALEHTRYIHVALLCGQESASDRPTMSDVIFMLKNQSTALPMAKQPAFLARRNSFEARIEMDRQGICSMNDVTISELEVR